MNRPVLITDFTHAYGAQGFPQALVEEGFAFELLDMSDIEGTRCYCDSSAEGEIRRRIAPYAGVPGIHWIDSGDFHYLSLFFASAWDIPFTLVLFDHHPDDQPPAFPGVVSCGGWVRDLREASGGRVRVLSVGPGGEYPSITAPLGPVYLSIDKDVLDPAFSRTDWSQGTLSLRELERMAAEVFAASDRILGIDICGELAPDQGATPEDARINRETNLSLMHFFNRMFL